MRPQVYMKHTQNCSILWKIMTATCSSPSAWNWTYEFASFECTKMCYVQNYQCLYNKKPSKTMANYTYHHQQYNVIVFTNKLSKVANK